MTIHIGSTINIAGPLTIASRTKWTGSVYTSSPSTRSGTKLVSIEGVIKHGTIVEPISTVNGLVTMCDKKVIVRPTVVHVIIDKETSEYGIHWFSNPIRGYNGFRVRVDNVVDVFGSTITFVP
jgi:hypothetical protein